MGAAEWILLAVTIVNVAGWAYIKSVSSSKSYGKLEQKVNDLDEIVKDGLMTKMNEVSEKVSRLEGTVNTYIKIKER